MGKIQDLGRYLILNALWLWFIGCGLDSDPPNRTGSAAPAAANSGVTLSGAGAGDDGDAGVYGGRSRITDIDSESNSDAHPNSAGMFGGAGTGGTFGDAAAGLGGRASKPSTISAGAPGAAGAHEDDDSAGAAGAGDQSVVVEVPPTLWFSEYVEGSSSYKALEIAALARSELEGCKVSAYFNGKVEATVIATLSGVLEAGQVLTLCSSALAQKLPDCCTQVGNLTFNGNDAIALSCDGTVLDVIGQIGGDPGAAWGVEPNTTADHTLRRKCTTQSGDPLGNDDFDPSIDWQTQAVDTFDGLGALGC